MGVSAEDSWARSSYPLQSSSHGSTRLLEPTAEDEVTSTQVPRGAPKSEDWYGAGTHHEIERYSTPVQLARASNFFLRQSTENLHGQNKADGSMSSRLDSQESRPNSSESAHSLHDPLSAKKSVSQELQMPGAWTRDSYPLNANENLQQSQHTHVLEPNRSVATERTLRRTSRSRRLNLSKSDPLADGTSLQFDLNEQTLDEYDLDGHSASSSRSDSGSSTALASSPPPSERMSKNTTEMSTDLPPNPTKESKMWRSKIYPLQAPASISELKDAATSEETRKEDNTAPALAQDSSRTPTAHNPWQNRKYPLQDPASNTSLRDSLEVDAVTTKSSPQRQIESRPKAIEEKRLKSWHRQSYPLQAPASNSNLHPSHSIPEEEEVESSGTMQAHGKSHNASNVSRQAVYPLQSPANNATREQPSTLALPAERNPTQNAGLSTKKSRESELAAKVVQQWRRQVYPVQSPDNVSPFHRAPTPQPPEEEVEKDSHQIHLPKNIPAVKDAKAHAPKGRTIVVCLDGTGDKFDNDNSNIVHLISALKKDDPRQVTYYQAGVGTYGAGGLSGGVTAALDMAVGSSLGLHVRDAYHFLMHTYKEGDKICIFGFSRGAYTARCLAGMIHKVGLLPARNLQQISFAYEFYSDDSVEGWKQSHDFKRTFCIDINVYYLGCFDSVASVGFIPRQLPLSSTPTNKPVYFRHAMALDERRAKFKICRHQISGVKETLNKSPTDKSVQSDYRRHHHMPNHKLQNDTPPSKSGSESSNGGKHIHPNLTDEEFSKLTAHDESFETDVLEVWFAGAHADIGGGAVLNTERHKLAQIPLRWMIRQAFECNTGIIFKTAVLAEHGLDVHTLWPKYTKLSVPAVGPPPSVLEKYEEGLPPKATRRGKLVPIGRHENGEEFFHLKSHKDEDWTPEQVEDFYDAMSPLNDQLVQAPNWWILEFWPVQYKVPQVAGQVATRTGMNLGRYRGVEDAEPNLHWTVLHRVEHTDYRILARTASNTRWQTVA